MKMLVVAFVLSFAVIGGGVAVSALSSTHVAACPQNSPNC
jgi:hypothetical protein